MFSAATFFFPSFSSYSNRPNRFVPFEQGRFLTIFRKYQNTHCLSQTLLKLNLHKDSLSTFLFLIMGHYHFTPSCTFFREGSEFMCYFSFCFLTQVAIHNFNHVETPSIPKSKFASTLICRHHVLVVKVVETWNAFLVGVNMPRRVLNTHSNFSGRRVFFLVAWLWLLHFGLDRRQGTVPFRTKMKSNKR